MITLYSKPNCPPCANTKRLLTRYNIEYRTLDISDQKNMDKLMAAGFFTVPVLNKGKTWIAGYKPKEIKELIGVSDV